jgi:uncharacterized peroxidase-related enzyme
MSSEPDRVHALNLPIPEVDELDPDMKGAFNHLLREDGFVPNVLRAYSFDQDKLRPLLKMYNSVMLAESSLSKLEREMIAVVVAAINRCVYCQTSHGAGVRTLSGDPILGDLLVQNYRAAKLSARQRAMLDFAAKMAENSATITEADRQGLRDVGFDDRAIWDIAAVAGFFSMSSRMSNALGMTPNTEYFFAGRTSPKA